MKNATELSAKLNHSADKIDGLMTSLQGFVGSPDLKGPLGELGDAAHSVRTLADNLDARTKDIAAGLSHFTSTGLREYEALAIDGRRTVNDLDRAIRSFEHNPNELLFGAEVQPSRVSRREVMRAAATASRPPVARRRRFGLVALALALRSPLAAAARARHLRPRRRQACAGACAARAAARRRAVRLARPRQRPHSGAHPPAAAGGIGGSEMARPPAAIVRARLTQSFQNAGLARQVGR